MYSPALQKVSHTKYTICVQLPFDIQALEEQKYQVILTSPEMCLKHDNFRGLISNPKFANHIAAIVINEAHCISQWGDKFREEYSKLGTLQAFVPSHVPVLVMSATMPPSVLSEVCSVMHIDMAKAYHLNLGVDRLNIAWEMRHMKAGKSDLDALQFILPQSCGGEGDKDTFKQTMVFGDNINTLMEAC